MKACLKTQDQFLEALYSELAGPRREEFERHLQSCPACREQFRALQATLEVMNRRQRPEPDADFWAGFSRQVKQLAAESESGWGARVFSFWRRAPRAAAAPPTGTLPHWAWRAAAVLAVLAVGILIGRLSWSPPARQQAEAPPPSAVDAAPPAEQRVSRYMERSKALLLGIVNIDPDDNGAEAIDFETQKQVSRQLVQEAPGLKQELSRSDDERLLELVAELEMILLQIANLEAQQDLEAVEVIREGVQRRGLLLRIQLEKSKRPSPQPAKQPRREI